MIVAIHQPQYLPWLGYFDKMLKADAFCYLDTVQYKKNEWQNRNRIRTAQGRQWLTVPVHYRFPARIDAVAIDNSTHWRHKHLQALRTHYRRAPYFEPTIAVFEEVYGRVWENLALLNLELIGRLREILGLAQKPALCASSLTCAEEPTERLIDICRALGGDTYLAGAGAAHYMDSARFEQRGLRVITQAFEHPVYPQVYKGFEPNLAIVDLIFNCGPHSADILRGGNLFRKGNPDADD